jgi:predicted RNA-binding protein associated with RNAse of E/G family
MNQNDTFRQAKLLYEATQQAGLAADPHAIAEKMKRLSAGLPPEDEFACLLTWSRRCALVHKLDQYQVPDFLVAFNTKREVVPLLVEVKSSNWAAKKGLFERRLRFTARYHSRLVDYAALVGLPLLVAWKVTTTGWTLFDIERMGIAARAYHISLDLAWKENLLGVLVGDFTFTLPESCAVVMKIRKEETISETEFVGRVEDAFYENPGGRTFKSVRRPFFEMFAYTADDVEIAEREDLITQRFYKLATEGVWAQQLLHAASHGFGTRDANWRKALQREELRYYLPDVLEAATDAGKKGLVGYIMHPVPQTVPGFLGGSYDSLCKLGL